MEILTDIHPKWLKWLSPDSFNDEELFRIITFFVFHSPCSDLSSMSKTLSEYGWSAPWQKPYYLNKQLKQLSSNYELLFSACRYDKMDTELEKANLKDNFPSDLSHERICFVNNKSNQFLSVFYHIRNAFAHCRLSIIEVDGECVFVFEDVQFNRNADKLKVSARMILRKSTLLNWIDLIESGEREYKKSLT